MINVLTLLCHQDAKDFEQMLHEAIARITDSEWRIHLFTSVEGASSFAQTDPVLEVLNWDLTVLKGLEGIKWIRPRYKNAFLMLLADAEMSPMLYIRPGISPNSLLLKPYTKLDLYTVLNEMITNCVEQEKEEDGESFLIDTRDGVQRIPYSQIYYIEAREKKIYIRTRSEEYGFYHTMEGMLSALPDYFQRCHRSYVVNMKKRFELTIC